MRALVLSLCAVLSLAAAHASYADYTGVPSAQACGTDLFRDVGCILAKTGAASAEQHARDGSELVRLFDWNADYRLLFVIEFVRERDGSARLRVARTTGDGHELTAPISQATWRAAQNAVDVYHNVALHPPASARFDPHGGAFEGVCMTVDGLTELVEDVRHGRVERVRSGDFDDPGVCLEPVTQLGETLRRLVVQAVPDCAAIVEDEPILLIPACASLSGDRRTAAGIYNRARPFWDGFCERDEPVERFLPLVAPGATLMAAGEAQVAGARDAVKAWRAITCGKGRYIAFNTIEAAGDTATVRGALVTERIETAPDGTNRYFDTRAPYVQHWLRGTDGSFRLTGWTVEAFGPEKLAE